MAEKNIIRQDVVQVLFQSDGVEDLLKGDDAVEKMMQDAKSAGDALVGFGKNAEDASERSYG